MGIATWPTSDIGSCSATEGSPMPRLYEVVSHLLTQNR